MCLIRLHPGFCFLWWKTSSDQILLHWVWFYFWCLCSTLGLHCFGRVLQAPHQWFQESFLRKYLDCLLVPFWTTLGIVVSLLICLPYPASFKIIVNYSSFSLFCILFGGFRYFQRWCVLRCREDLVERFQIAACQNLVSFLRAFTRSFLHPLEMTFAIFTLRPIVLLLHHWSDLTEG